MELRWGTSRRKFDYSAHLTTKVRMERAEHLYPPETIGKRADKNEFTPNHYARGSLTPVCHYAEQ